MSKQFLISKWKLTGKDFRKIAIGVAFLLPNIVGFFTFVAGPLLISLVMSFTDWNLELHNAFRSEPIKFVGFTNYIRLLSEPDFLKYLGNTLFFMIGIPFGIGGSLCAALLLNHDFKSGSKSVWKIILVTCVLIVSTVTLILTGMGATAMTLLVCGLAGMILIGGCIGGQTVYRTLFYFPHFTAGVATYILWKKLYSPDTGPINNALQPLLDFLSPICKQISGGTAHTVAFVLVLVTAGLFVYRVVRNLRAWKDGDYGTLSLILNALLLSVPVVLASIWGPFAVLSIPLRGVIVAGLAYLFIGIARGRKHPCPVDRSLADGVVLGGLVMVVSLVALGLGIVAYDLPQTASDGFDAPTWIADYYWAKPSLMMMGFWGAIGSNNMLLYLAGLSGVPQDLYEAADIDGASSVQRFWHITWPQLANITFFILVMSIIGGLQGGFEMARTMTHGGPAGATTTLSYYIYTEGFETGRLGYASAVAWALFAMIFSVTVFNWKFGNRYTNE